MIKIREGNTGILYINEGETNPFTYKPDYDLDKGKELLIEFLNRKDIEGRKIKENYNVDGINWFAAQYTHLFWNVFFQFIKYERFIIEYLDGKDSDIIFVNEGNFHSLYYLLYPSAKSRSLKPIIYNILLGISNRRTLAKYNPELLFYCFTPDDFRARDIKKAVDESRVKYVKVVGSTKDLLLTTLRKNLPNYFIGSSLKKNIFNRKYNIDDKSLRDLLHLRIVLHIEERMSAQIYEMKMHLNLLKKSGVKILYGFDEANAIMPLLFAVKKMDIKNIAHQHGAYVKRHFGYMWDGLERDEIIWWDKLIVWGKYWKDQLLHYSKYYKEEDFLIGCNKFDMNPARELKSYPVNPGNLNILIPYEFLADTIEIGKYIKKLLSLGHKVYFKPRNDEELEDQLTAYNLNSEEQTKIIVAASLNEETIEKIDVVAGTMTTLIYELMPYNKIIWYFETDYRHLYDLVEQGYAQLIRLEELENIDPSKLRSAKVDSEYFFNTMSVKEVIRKFVLER